MSKVALAPGCAREYETIYILRPNLDKESAEQISNRVADAIKGHGGKMTAVELWGRRRLAYPISRHHRGIYVYLKYLGIGETVSELERQLKLADNVIRFQTIQLRSNIPVEADIKEEEFALDFDLPEEPDEPELTRERELGLDTPPPDRRRRGDFGRDRDHHSDDDASDSDEGVDSDDDDSQMDGDEDKEG